MEEDEKLLRRAEQALAEIKVAQGLSDEHASVLAALRIRLKGDPGSRSLDDLLSAAGDLGKGPRIDELMERKQPEKRSLDDVLKQPRPKPKWPPD